MSQIDIPASVLAPARISALAFSVAHAEPRRNYYGDPFVQATSALPGCPVPEGPLITHAEMQAQAHGRVDRGTTCFRSGRCRLARDPRLRPRACAAGAA